MPDLPRDNDGKLSAYAWPGGYPLYYLDSEMSVLCVACARQFEYFEHMPYRPVAYEINWEDGDVYCDECSKRIERAYGDDEKEEA